MKKEIIADIITAIVPRITYNFFTLIIKIIESANPIPNNPVINHLLANIKYQKPSVVSSGFPQLTKTRIATRIKK